MCDSEKLEKYFDDFKRMFSYSGNSPEMYNATTFIELRGNYLVILEAEALIVDFLKQNGRFLQESYAIGMIEGGDRKWCYRYKRIDVL